MEDPTPHWRALRPGYFELKGEPLTVTVLKLDDLPVPSGRLIIKDANGFGYGPQRAVPLIPGSYGMSATCVEQGEVSMLAYLSLEIGSKTSKAKAWREITPVHREEQEEDVAERLRGGFINRSAYGLMVDESLLKQGIPMDDEHCFSLLCYWQNRIDDLGSVWEGGRYPIGEAKEGLPVTMFKTRRMSGLTKIYAEVDEMGFLLRLHVDVGLMERLYHLGQ